MKKPRRYYIVGLVEKSRKVEIKDYRFQADLPLSWADGMVGACPVFSNKKKAKKYCRKDDLIIIVEEVPK